MTPHYADDWLTVYLGDCRAVMAEMPAESVHCVVTSPPYWGLRDYGQPGQLGLEPTPEEYVADMVDVFREVRRVLRSDGTVWLNLGDSYASNPASGGERVPRPGIDKDAGAHQRTPDNGWVRPVGLKPKDLVGIPWRVAFALQADGWYLRSDIIWAKPNPMPESVTDRPTKAHEYLFLLSKSPRYYYDADAVRESPLTGVWPGIGPKHGTTDNHKSDYEPMTVNPSRNLRSVWTIATQPYPGAHFATFPRALVEPCIKAGTSEKGVCPEAVVVSDVLEVECGAPWVRETRPSTVPRDMDRPQVQRAVALAEAAGLTEEHFAAIRSVGATDAGKAQVTQDGYGENAADVVALASEAKAALGGYYREFLLTEPTTIGWRPTCRHYDRANEWPDLPSKRPGESPSEIAPAVALRDELIAHFRPMRTVPATVLDPFAGSGTTALVAQHLSRRAVLIDLSADYLRQVMDRNRDIPLGLA
jgi:site-specific DNA-methyltransferase (adenine-specific)